MTRKEEVQEQLDKIMKYRIAADDKESKLKEEMTNIIMHEYISGLRALQRNQKEISERDFEVLMKGFAREVVQLYTGTKPW